MVKSQVPIRSVELKPDLIPLALTSPAEVHGILAEEVRERYGPAAELGVDVRIDFPLDRLLRIPHEAIWSGHPGATIYNSTEELLGALRNLTHEEIFNSHYGPVDHGAYHADGYLRCTRVRVLRLHEALQRMGIPRNGTILEIGSLFGSFAFILQRLGYQVTAVDRYRSYGPGFSAAVNLMKQSGVQIVSTTREDEHQVIEALGRYDAVIAMAVVEHIPHTPRLFVEQLCRCVKPGGIIALDTPNLARYWNRIKLANGESVFMDIKSQYYAELPYEGHHREYTGAELRWMLGQVGCKEIESVHFDYNLHQFEQIDQPHIECLLRIIEDPTYADTILVYGRVNALRTPSPDLPK